MFTKSGVLKLTGFGKSVDLTRDNLHIREKESTLYLAPELEEGYVTVKSPYWNLGRILNEISADIVLSPKTTCDKEYTEFVNGLKKRSTADRIGFYDPRLMPKFLETKREKLFINLI
ncbi:hypothetical protein MHBO_001403 [Bonamia ostreae]|uniref:Protein kinase domain-containing protein n=1 Tax=Bonamia ostreae TaxID=126728 RepID=A0ABV2AIX6_9EUKA